MLCEPLWSCDRLLHSRPSVLQNRILQARVKVADQKAVQHDIDCRTYESFATIVHQPEDLYDIEELNGLNSCINT